MRASPKGLTDSFVDHLARIVQQLAQAKMAPDTDLEFIGEIENIILDYIRGAPSTPTPIGAQSYPQGVPVSEAQMSRGPAPSIPQGPMAQEIASL